MGKVLIIADVKNKCFATPRGLELAARLKRDTDVVAFTYASLKHLNDQPDEQARIREQLLAEREKEVRARIEKHRQPQQKVDLDVVWEKDIHHWINKKCKSGGYDAVLKTGHRSETLVHTPTDWELLRQCPAPVLLVAENKWHRTRPVLVTLDLASKSRTKKALNSKLLAAGKLLAQTLEVELEIITAVEIPTLLADMDLVDPIAYVKSATASMQPQILKLAAAHDIPARNFRCKRGPVSKVITSRAAKVRAQIVVMGTVGRKGVKARLLGNTAEKVLRHIKTDVLAIKP